MRLKYSTQLSNIFEYSKEEAIRLESKKISVEHLFLAILRDKDNDAYRFLEDKGLDVKALKEKVETFILNNDTQDTNNDLGLFTQTREVVDAMSSFVNPKLDKEIGSIHLLLSILKLQNSFISKILNDIGVNFSILNLYYEQEFETSPENMFEDFDDLISEKNEPIKPGVPQISAIKIDAEELRDKLGFGIEKFVEKLQNPDGLTPMENQIPMQMQQQQQPPQEQEYLSVLDEFGTDLVEEAEKGNLEKIIGRTEEIDRILHVLSKKRKNNAILIGDPGVGKTAIVEALSQRLASNDVPFALVGKRIIAVDISSMVSGTRFRGEFEARMTRLVNEAIEEEDVILYFDEIHNLIGAGNPSGSLDAANILKPALAKGFIRCIGTTTFDEYREFFEDNQALERRFEKVYVEEPTQEEAVEILEGAKEYYQQYHNVRFSKESINTAVKLSERYLTDRKLPDKALNLLDEAGAKKNLLIKESKTIKDLTEELNKVISLKELAVSEENYESASDFRVQEIELIKKLDKVRDKEKASRLKKPFKIGVEEIKKTLSLLTGIPVSSLSLNKDSKIINLESNLKKEVIGQDEAIEKLVKSLKRNYAGLRNPNKPIGTFIFLGSTGVGKTQLAKSISEQLFDDDDSLIRFDMSEFMDKASVSRLVGTSPGYVGYEEGGELTEKIKHNQYSVVLFDEIEKAHKDIFNILLQILDEGIITDGHGRTVNMKNTVIIMTSNIGVKKAIEFGKGIGFNTEENNDPNHIIEKELKKTFSPEFLNRVDDIVFFKSLDKKAISSIIDLKIKKLFERAEELGFHISLAPSAKKQLLEQAFSPLYGARPIERKIQELIENEISELIIHKKINKDDKIKIKFVNKKFAFEKQG